MKNFKYFFFKKKKKKKKEKKKVKMEYGLELGNDFFNSFEEMKETSEEKKKKKKKISKNKEEEEEKEEVIEQNKKNKSTLTKSKQALEAILVEFYSPFASVHQKIFKDENIDFQIASMKILSNRKYYMPNGVKKYNAIKTEYLADGFGEMEYNLLCDVAKMVVSLPNASVLPLEWEIDDSTQIKVEFLDEKYEEIQQKSPNTILGFLQSVAQKYNRNQDIPLWEILMRKNKIKDLHELKKLNSNDWDKLEGFAQIEIVLFRNAIAEYNFYEKEKKEVKEDSAIFLGKIHMVKRYLYSCCNKLKQLPLLCSLALSKAIKETVEIYKGGDIILSQIKQAMEGYLVKLGKGQNYNRGVLLYGPPGTGTQKESFF